MLGSVQSSNADSVDWTSDAPMPPPEDAYSPQMYRSPVPPTPQRPFDQRFYPQPSPSPYPQGQFTPSISPHSGSSQGYMNSPMSVQTYPGSQGAYSNYQMMQSPPAAGSMMQSPHAAGSQSAPPPPLHSPTPGTMPMTALQNLRLNPTGERRGITLKQMENYPNTVHVFPDSVNEAPIAPRVFADFVDGDPWCQIKLYEMDIPDTKIFKTEENQFWVDGYCSTTKPQRFSIGALNTPGQKSSVYRLQIGKGIRIEQDGDDVYVTNEGKGPIFIQCPNYARMQHDSDDTVYRIAACTDPMGNEIPVESRTIKVFDFSLFKHSFDSATTQSSLGNICALCTTRISFLKGFGSKYVNRPNISLCPVWIEMQLLKRLWQIDKRIDEFPQPIPQPEDLF